MYLLCDHLKSSSLVVKIHSYYYHVITYHTRAKMRKNSAIQGNQTSAFFFFWEKSKIFNAPVD